MPPQLRQYQREHAFTLLLNSMTQSHVSRQLGAHQATICRLLKRPCDTAHLHNRFLRSVEIAATTHGTHTGRIHPDTLRNRLREHGN